MPVETRTLAPVMPAARRAAGVMEAWLMVSGCSTRDSTPPRDSASVKIRRAPSSRSARSIAGIYSPDLRVLGLMPHAEDLVDPLMGGTDGRPLYDGLAAALAA